MECALKKLWRKPSMPSVFIGSELVGGTNEVVSLNVRGKLKPRLIKISSQEALDSSLTLSTTHAESEHNASSFSIN
ncbi:hypothetical protein RJ639_018026 [Escallonia herrerae]|uniref:Uncharacterized protein n=1 Tax=Escallonia herrerae TaxID=1293975 RepID=A0AA88VBU7_9ASTE|nr:hypothetical protein RJ639_018026 [Escallonia herrerae]